MDLFAAEINPTEGIATVRALFIAGLSLALLFIGLAALVGPGRTGNSKAVWTRIAASTLALIPVAIALGMGASAFGVNVLEWLFPSFA